jgi:3-methyladenine DNA glycosylase AlkD
VPLPSMDAAIKETLGDLSQGEALDLCRRLWREPVWDLKIVAGRILARKGIAPDAKVWGFVTERLSDLDGWAVADNLASAASRCLIEDSGRLDVVETWIENPHLWTRRAALVFTLPWAKEKRDPERMLGWAARLADDRQWFIQKAIG